MLCMNVDVALGEVPVNILPLTDDTDFKTIESAVAYNAAGMALRWNFVDTSGNCTSTAVTPTTSGTYDWTHQGGGMYTIEIPASGGASINNDTEGFGWFSGVATGVLPWRGPIICFRAALLNDLMINSGRQLEEFFGVVAYGNLDAGDANGFTIPAAMRTKITTGQVIRVRDKSDGRIIATYNSGTGVGTVSPAFDSAAAAADPFAVFLQAPAASVPDVNVYSVNDTQIQGTGVLGDSFRPV